MILLLMKGIHLFIDKIKRRYAKNIRKVIMLATITLICKANVQ